MELSLIRKILVVEDESELRELILETLSEAGFEVSGARDGAEALRLIESGAFQLVLSDIQMPVMTGFELLSALKERRIGVPVIILSAFGEPEKVKAAKALGAIDFLEKPFRVSALLDAIRRVAQQPSDGLQNPYIAQ